MNKLQHLFGALCMSAALFCHNRASAQDQLPPTPAEAVQQAEAGLSKALQWIHPDDIDLYGFRKTDDFSAIRIGKPIYQQYFSSPDGRDRELATSAVLLPLILHDRVRCFLYLAQEDGRWQLTGIGGRNEANAWEKQVLGADHMPQQDRMLLLHLNNSNQDYLQDNESTATYREVTLRSAGTNTLTLDQLYESAVQAAAQARLTADPSSN